MEMHQQNIIKKFLLGKANKKEVRKVAEYLFSEEVEKALDNSIENEFDNKDIDISSFDTANNWQNINNSITTKNVVNTSPTYFIHKIAAGLLIIAIASFFIYKNAHHPIKDVISTYQQTTKLTEKGQKLHLSLPDRSMVTLNAETEITYTNNFADGNRLVYLEGEAFFEIKSDTAKPFTVITPQLTIKVLGTSFNVKAHGNKAMVALQEGKVELTQKNGKSLLLAPGDIIESTNGELTMPDLDITSVVGWKEGLLYFEKENLDQVINKMERWYGVTFKTTGNTSNKYHYTGKFKNKSLREVLEGISFVMNFQFKIEGNQVTIKQ